MSSGLQTDVSKKTPGRPEKRCRERGEVGDAAVGDDQLGVVALDELGQAVGDRRQAAAAVDQDRDAAVGRELEHRREPLVVQVELLRARVQLDPACAGVEAASRLGDRLLGQVEPHERHEAPVRALGEGQRPVVRGAEGRVPVGLVEAEHERARDPVQLLSRDQLVEVADHPVDVGAEMDVRVEDLGILGQLRACERREALDQRLRPQKDVFHLSFGVYARRLCTLPRRYSRYGCGSIASAPIARWSVSIGVNFRPCR